jgi:hypothetical protein
MGSASQPRDQRGRWTAGGSGSETGDHLSESPSTDTRNVPGHGNVPRSQVVAKHSGAVSVGTEPPTVRLDNRGSPKDKTPLKQSARRERIEMRLAADQRHYPSRSDRVATAMADHGKPTGTRRGWPFNN